MPWRPCLAAAEMHQLGRLRIAFVDRHLDGLGMRQIDRDLTPFFANFDALLTPTLCLPPLPIGNCK